MKNLFLPVAFFVLFLGAPLVKAANIQNMASKIVVIKEKADGYSFGLEVKTPKKQTLQKLKLNGGAEVVYVEKGSAADKAGLKPHDIIVKFDGTPILGPEDLARVVDMIDEQKTVDVVINRDGKELILTATIYPAEDDRDRDENEDMYRWPWRFFGMNADSFPHFDTQFAPFLQAFKKGGYLGVAVDNLTDQLLQYFKADYGVLIKKVLKNSPAEKAGLKAGDVIYKINDKKIKDAADLVRTIQYYDPGDTITIYFIRNGKKKSVKVKLAKKEGWPGWRSVFPGFWMERFRGPNQRFRKPIFPPKTPDYYFQTPQERRRGIYKF